MRGVWLVEYIDARRPQWGIALDLEVIEEGTDQESGRTLARAVIRPVGSVSSIFPPAEHFPGQIVDRSATICIEYLPGLRGRAGEIGVRAWELGAGTWLKARRGIPSLPPLTTDEEIQEWVEQLRAIP